MITLELPDEKYKETFIRALADYQAAPPDACSYHYNAYNIKMVEKNFDSVVTMRKSIGEFDTRKYGGDPYKEFWIIDDGEYVGRVCIADKITDKRMKDWGNIGFDVIPKMREKGYAKAALKLALKKAAEMGLGEIKISCGENNTGSRKTIENVMELNNGRQLKKYISPYDNEPSIMYLIPTTVNKRKNK